MCQGTSVLTKIWKKEHVKEIPIYHPSQEPARWNPHTIPMYLHQLSLHWHMLLRRCDLTIKSDNIKENGNDCLVILTLYHELTDMIKNLLLLAKIYILASMFVCRFVCLSVCLSVC